VLEDYRALLAAAIGRQTERASNLPILYRPAQLEYREDSSDRGRAPANRYGRLKWERSVGKQDAPKGVTR
jgi:hypothetical protein